MSRQHYDTVFYRSQVLGSRTSARTVIPLIQELVNPKSVLDVGCGVGTWAGVWRELGVEDVVGVDGDYVDRTMLEIPQDRFLGRDLTRPLDLGRSFDLVSCLEVAEHLPAESARTLVQSLVRHSDVVVFSAAVPRQGGTKHINEQWPSYWIELFTDAGFGVYDPFRALIWFKDEVEVWYRQNLLLFVAANHPLRGYLKPPAGPVDIVHPALLESFARPAARYLALRARFATTPAGKAVLKIREAARHRKGWAEK